VIVGTGVDLCEVDRIKKAICSSHGARFLERVFTAREIAYSERKASPYERYAARIYAFGPAVNASQDLTRANRSVCFI
jgi:phosphopantetheinyl transferase (holo-ACP synthase)